MRSACGKGGHLGLHRIYRVRRLLAPLRDELFQGLRPLRLLRYQHTAERIVKACATWFVGFLGFSLMFKFQPAISRIFVVISAVTVTIGLLAWRYAFHRFLQHSKVAANLRQRVLFVGWNDESQKLQDSFEADAVRPYEVSGCVTLPGSQFHLKPSVPVLGDTRTWPRSSRST